MAKKEINYSMKNMVIGKGFERYMSERKYMMNKEDIQICKIWVLILSIILFMFYCVVCGYFIMLAIYGGALAFVMLFLYIDNVQERLSVWFVLRHTRHCLYDELIEIYKDYKNEMAMRKELAVLNAEINNKKYFSIVITVASIACGLLYMARSSLKLNGQECIIIGLGLCLLVCILLIIESRLSMYNIIKKDVLLYKIETCKNAVDSDKPKSKTKMRKNNENNGK